MTHYYGCPKLLFTVSFDDSLDIRMLALSGKSDTLQWLDTLQHKQPSDVSSCRDRARECYSNEVSRFVRHEF